jgi:hypothetical protein
MKYLLIPVLSLAIFVNTFAQSASDALRYSRTQHFGTARMAGVGGAFSALGAEFGSVSLNPAGLAMFRSDEFMFTPGVYFASTDASVPNGPVTSGEATKFRFTNLGLVFNSDPGEKSDWKTFNVGLGYNQLANFNQRINYESTGSGTILKGWFDDAEPFLAGGGDPENLYALGAGMAYKAGAIYFIDGAPSYDFAGNENATIYRTHNVNTSGAQNEMTLSFAGNYKEKLMIGATIGVPMINYRQSSTYTESDPGGGYQGNVTYFDNLTYTDDLRTRGVGVNAKIGATFRVSQAIRIGGAFHTPSFLNLTDNFSTTLNYVYEDQDASGSGNILTFENSGEGNAEPFNYRLRTPWKAVFGGALLVKKYGFISGDVEWIDYSSSHFNLTKNQTDASTRAYEAKLNTTISTGYKAVTNYRFGAEAVLDIFRLRVGYNMLGKAKKDQTGFNNAISFGAGIRMKTAYIDLAFRRSTANGSVSADSGADVLPIASTESKINDILMTVGFKF